MGVVLQALATCVKCLLTLLLGASNYNKWVWSLKRKSRLKRSRKHTLLHEARLARLRIIVVHNNRRETPWFPWFYSSGIIELILPPCVVVCLLRNGIAGLVQIWPRFSKRESSTLIWPTFDLALKRNRIIFDPLFGQPFSFGYFSSFSAGVLICC